MNQCSSCNHWQRDGGDGICRANAPSPAIVVKPKNQKHELTLVWPRTQADEWCSKDYEAFNMQISEANQ